MNVRTLPFGPRADLVSPREDDAAPTLVMHTRVMDRHDFPSSGVVPVAIQDPSPRLRLVPPNVEVAPPPPRPAIDFDAPFSAELTQPSRLKRREVSTYRRLSIGLGIALAFALGLAGSFALQVNARSSAAASRAPRVAITKSPSLRLVDGAEDKRGLAATADPAAEPSSNAKTKPKRAKRPAPQGAQGAATDPASAAPASAEDAAEKNDAVSPADLLDKGIAAD